MSESMVDRVATYITDVLTGYLVFGPGPWVVYSSVYGAAVGGPVFVGDDEAACVDFIRHQAARAAIRAMRVPSRANLESVAAAILDDAETLENADRIARKAWSAVIYSALKEQP